VRPRRKEKRAPEGDARGREAEAGGFAVRRIRATGSGTERSEAAGPPAREPDEDLVDADLDELVFQLKKRSLALGETIRSSREYWAGVHRVLNLRVALEQAEGRFRELYDFIPTPFLVLDSHLRIESANAAAIQLLGPSASAEGMSLHALLSPEEQQDVAGVLAEAGAPRPIEVLLRTGRGRKAAQMTALAVDDSGFEGQHPPRRRGYYVVLVDISDIRRLEDERQSLERERRLSQEAERAAREADRAKDEFIAILSHELRTPLTPVLAALGTMDAERLPSSAREAIAVIRRNVHAEARLIDDLLDVARIRQGRLGIDRRLFSLHDLLAQVLVDWQPEAARRGLAVDLVREARADVVHADRERIAQVLRNVLGNATKFTDAGGRVTVRTSDDHGRVRVAVTDTGAGIGPDELDRLFLTFAGARRAARGRSGLGLGLAISRGILEAHGGRIRVTSRGAGLGTSVEIELELAGEAAQGAAPVDRSPPPRTCSHPKRAAGRRQAAGAAGRGPRGQRGDARDGPVDPGLRGEGRAHAGAGARHGGGLRPPHQRHLAPGRDGHRPPARGPEAPRAQGDRRERLRHRGGRAPQRRGRLLRAPHQAVRPRSPARDGVPADLARRRLSVTGAERAERAERP
jgi:signal transduction histidine kinase